MALTGLRIVLLSSLGKLRLLFEECVHSCFQIKNSTLSVFSLALFRDNLNSSIEFRIFQPKHVFCLNYTYWAWIGWNNRCGHRTATADRLTLAIRTSRNTFEGPGCVLVASQELCEFGAFYISRKGDFDLLKLTFLGAVKKEKIYLQAYLMS